MPRRATSTSFGQKGGNRRNTTTPGTGAPTKTFYGRMAALAERNAVVKRLETMLGPDSDDATFLKAFKEVADRGHGAAKQQVDLTSGGQPLLGADERATRILALLELAKARGKK